jgi:hypothetical protein
VPAHTLLTRSSRKKRKKEKIFCVGKYDVIKRGFGVEGEFFESICFVRNKYPSPDPRRKSHLDVKDDDRTPLP